MIAAPSTSVPCDVTMSVVCFDQGRRTRDETYSTVMVDVFDFCVQAIKDVSKYRSLRSTCRNVNPLRFLDQFVQSWLGLRFIIIIYGVLCFAARTCDLCSNAGGKRCGGGVTRGGRGHAANNNRSPRSSAPMPHVR